MSHFYITTTLPYVNASPHIGFGLEILAADVIARWHRLNGDEVVFNTGTDEHGAKIYQNALDNHQDPQEYVDFYAAQFDQLKEQLNLSYTNFIRTTDVNHQKAAQYFWQLCLDKGDIYLAKYPVKYCVGCELEKNESDLVDGHCPLHPNLEIEVREEENYFFRFSKYQSDLLEFYKQHPSFVKPNAKMKEIVSFVEQGLQDFSISRLKEKMPWGVPVPNDDQHVMYVWFDALINYISTLGWPDDQDTFKKFWPGVQVAGKDNLRQQSAMWQAMLMSADLPNSSQILINGFISVGGQKMSKSLGNVISPFDLVDKYGIDGARYVLLSLGPFDKDMDVTWERFNQLYTAELANGLGNLASRVAKLANQSGVSLTSSERHKITANFEPAYVELMRNYQLGVTLSLLVDWVKETDEYLSQTKPWLLSGSERSEIVKSAVKRVFKIAVHLEPFLPQTTQQLTKIFSAQPVEVLTPLFPRLA